MSPPGGAVLDENTKSRIVKSTEINFVASLSVNYFSCLSEKLEQYSFAGL